MAGEPSGDRLAADLIRGLKALDPDLELRGVAGPLMQAEGMESIFAMQELSVMGIGEVLPKYRHLMRRIAETAQAAVDWAPDVVISVDSPDFSFRVAKRIKAASDLRTVHYVAPTVWAWRPKRAAKVAKVIDHILALFPFEPPYFEREGMACDFVGHPVAVEAPVSEDDIAAFRARHGLEGKKAICLLPGSRKTEVERLMHGLLDAVARADIGDVRLVLPTLPHLAPHVRRLLGSRDALVLDGAGLTATEAAAERRIAMAASHLALAASGTVSLELASVRTPMVIAYDMNWFSRQIIIKRMLLIDTVTLVNLVSETRSVEEFIGEGFEPHAIAAALERVDADPEAQIAAMETTMARLGEGGDPPGLRAARAILSKL